MGRLKPRHPKRETSIERFEKRMALRVLVKTQKQDQQDALLEMFGDVMSDNDKAALTRATPVQQ